MSVSLTNIDGKIAFSYITGNGILTTNNGEITQTANITESELSSDLQNKINSIDTINCNLIWICNRIRI